MSGALTGEVALVTGASRGIGRSIALELAAHGATLALHYVHDEGAAREVADAVVAAGGAAPRLFHADFVRPESAGEVVEACLQAFGRIDVLVNNAGIQRSAMAHKMADEDWHEVLAVNLSAPFFASRAALQAMREARSGHIIMVASASSFVAQAGAASYVTAKHGLIGLTKALALESASRGIRVNAVAPGLTDTDMVRGLSPEQRAGLERLVPMGRLGTPEEVANVVGWLATSASYCTGTTLHVSGGVVLG